MSENNVGGLSRARILYILQILREKTDEDNYITAAEIERELERVGISAGRKAIYEDIEALRLYGADIISRRGKYAGYFLADREFELPELKLLADAVSSAKFLTEKKSRELLKKIEGLASVHQGRQIQRQLYVADRVKSFNEKIYISVDAIHRAVAEGKKISFKYFDYDISKRKIYRDGMRVCSPYALTWDDSRYYLVAYYPKYSSVVNFRVDRMESVEVLEEKADKKPEGFSLSEYLGSTFSMFSGETCGVKLRFDSSLINVVLDRFGKDVMTIPDGDLHFTVNVKVKPEAPFFGWLFQFGKRVRILSPENVKEKYGQMLKETLENI